MLLNLSCIWVLIFVSECWQSILFEIFVKGVYQYHENLLQCCVSVLFVKEVYHKNVHTFCIV